MIKSTLAFLKKVSQDYENLKEIRNMEIIFGEIPESDNIDRDFLNLKKSRLISHYDLVLSWCKVFLKKESFTMYKGEDVAFALLFPMERIFEDYVTYLLKKYLSDFEVKAQDKEHYLLQDNLHPIRPDIVIKNKNENVFVLDVKWKLIDNEEAIKGISISDLYQVFAYGKFYRSNNVCLIYPLSNDGGNENKEYFFQEFKNNEEENILLNVFFVDLSKILKNEEEAINEIIYFLDVKKEEKSEAKAGRIFLIIFKLL